MRVFTELTPECDKTAQLFARGYEKKEIAEIKCRSFYTINNQINTAFEKLRVRNGRELSILYSERCTGKSILDLSERSRRILSIVLITVFVTGFHMSEMPRQRRTGIRISRVVSRRMEIETSLIV